MGPTIVIARLLLGGALGREACLAAQDRRAVGSRLEGESPAVCSNQTPVMVNARRFDRLPIQRPAIELQCGVGLGEDRICKPCTTHLIGMNHSLRAINRERGVRKKKLSGCEATRVGIRMRRSAAKECQLKTNGPTQGRAKPPSEIPPLGSVIGVPTMVPGEGKRPRSDARIRLPLQRARGVTGSPGVREQCSKAALKDPSSIHRVTNRPEGIG